MESIDVASRYMSEKNFEKIAIKLIWYASNRETKRFENKKTKSTIIYMEHFMHFHSYAK